MSKLTVIQLLNKIANGEEVPNHIKISDDIYHFSCDDGDYYNDIGNAPSLLERIWRHNALVWLNLKLEIIEDEFIDIEEIKLERDDILGYYNGASHRMTTNVKDREVYIKIINNLIKNQKKIIDKLNKE